MAGVTGPMKLFESDTARPLTGIPEIATPAHETSQPG